MQLELNFFCCRRRLFERPFAQRDWRANAKPAAQYGELMLDVYEYIYFASPPSAYFDVVTRQLGIKEGAVYFVSASVCVQMAIGKCVSGSPSVGVYVAMLHPLHHACEGEEQKY